MTEVRYQEQIEISYNFVVDNQQKNKRVIRQTHATLLVFCKKTMYEIFIQPEWIFLYSQHLQTNHRHWEAVRPFIWRFCSLLKGNCLGYFGLTILKINYTDTCSIILSDVREKWKYDDGSEYKQLIPSERQVFNFLRQRSIIFDEGVRKDESIESILVDSSCNRLFCFAGVFQAIYM